MTDTEVPKRPGLRERKKAKTRAAIRECAMRLFYAQGYEATTVEQIAEAAEVSPSTFFRYFRTKEDVVLSDEYDPLLIRAFDTQPAGLTPLQAMRRAFRQVIGRIPPSELAEIRQRVRLMHTVPALRAAFLDDMAESGRRLESLVARRAGRDPADPSVRAFAGAVQGVLLSVYVHWQEHPEGDLAKAIDEALALLEAGLPL